MEADRRAAIIAGILFIIATVLGLASTALTSSVLGASDYLTKIYSSQNQIVLGALFQFVASVACAGIAISLYPVLKRYNEGLALGSVGLRIIEAVFGIITALCLLSLVTLSQDFVNAGSPPGSDYQTLGTLIKAVSNWFGYVFLVLAFTLAALIYYYIFYRTRLIPRWLAAWGSIGAALSMSAAIWAAFGEPPLSTPFVVLNIPIAVQEMILAVWLIVKGFDRSALASLVVKQTPSVGIA